MLSNFYKFYLILTKSNILKSLAYINEYESYPYKKKRKIQKSRLESLLIFSTKNIDYYKKFGNRKYDAFPILTKKLLRKNLIFLRNRVSGLSTIENTSGGTTGEPIRILQDKNYKTWSRAYKEFYYQKAEYTFGKKLIKLWGSERDIIIGNFGLKNKLLNYLRHQKFLNTFMMSENDIYQYIKTINRFQPDVIEAYVQSLYEICRFAINNNLSIYQPKSIIVSAGTYYDFMESIFKQVFPEVPIYNRYGSREVGDIGCSCGGRKFIHISMLTHYVEVVDNNNKSIIGKPGRIIVTSLTNYAQPLIRYEIGDIGVMFPYKKCPSCGWEGDILEIVKGRTVEVFKNIYGELIDGEYFTHLFYFREWLEKFQVNYFKKKNILELKIKLNPQFKKIPKNDKKEIEENILKVMKRCKIVWKIVKNIFSNKSGKFCYTRMYE